MSAFDPLRTLERHAKSDLMAGAKRDILAELPLEAVSKVTFYKRDEITTDVICCDVVVRDKVRTFHEELACWDALIDHFQKLPGFRGDWFAAVSQPPFAVCEMVAFTRL